MFVFFVVVFFTRTSGEDVWDRLHADEIDSFCFYARNSSATRWSFVMVTYSLLSDEQVKRLTFRKRRLRDKTESISRSLKSSGVLRKFGFFFVLDTPSLREA